MQAKSKIRYKATQRYNVELSSDIEVNARSYTKKIPLRDCQPRPKSKRPPKMVAFTQAPPPGLEPGTF